MFSARANNLKETTTKQNKLLLECVGINFHKYSRPQSLYSPTAIICMGRSEVVCFAVVFMLTFNLPFPPHPTNY